MTALPCSRASELGEAAPAAADLEHALRRRRGRAGRRCGRACVACASRASGRMPKWRRGILHRRRRATGDRSRCRDRNGRRCCGGCRAASWRARDVGDARRREPSFQPLIERSHASVLRAARRKSATRSGLVQSPSTYDSANPRSPPKTSRRRARQRLSVTVACGPGARLAIDTLSPFGSVRWSWPKSRRGTSRLISRAPKDARPAPPAEALTSPKVTFWGSFNARPRFPRRRFSPRARRRTGSPEDTTAVPRWFTARRPGLIILKSRDACEVTVRAVCDHLSGLVLIRRAKPALARIASTSTTAPLTRRRNAGASSLHGASEILDDARIALFAASSASDRTRRHQGARRSPLQEIAQAQAIQAALVGKGSLLISVLRNQASRPGPGGGTAVFEFGRSGDLLSAQVDLLLLIVLLRSFRLVLAEPTSMRRGLSCSGTSRTRSIVAGRAPR